MSSSAFQRFTQLTRNGSTGNTGGSFSDDEEQKINARDLYNSYMRQVAWEEEQRNASVYGSKPAGTEAMENVARPSNQAMQNIVQANREERQSRAEALPDLEKKKSGDISYAPDDVKAAQSHLDALDEVSRKLLETYGRTFYNDGDLQQTYQDKEKEKAARRSHGAYQTETNENTYSKAAAQSGSKNTLQNSNAQRMASELMEKNGWSLDQLNNALSDAKTVGKYKYSNSTYLTPEEEQTYNRASIEALSSGEQKALSLIQKGQEQNDSDTKYDMWGTGLMSLARGYAQKAMGNDSDYGEGYKSIEEGRAILKNEYGWDDDKIHEYELRSKRLADEAYAEQQQEDMDFTDEDDSTAEKIVKGAGSWMYGRMAAIPSITSVLSNLEEKPEGQGRNMYSTYDSYRRAREALSSNVQQDYLGNDTVLDNNIVGEWIKNTTGSNVGQFLYGTSESLGDSALLMNAGGAIAEGLGVAGASAKVASALKNGTEVTSAMKKAATAEKIIQNVAMTPFMTEGYESAYRSARESGSSEEGAQMRGIAGGMAEYITEKISLDNAWELARGTKAGKNILINMLAQGAIEGSEEMTSDLLNDIADQVISNAQNDKLSDYDQRVSDYVTEGMSEEDAKTKVLKEKVSEYAADGLAGALSGLGMGAGATVQGYQTANYNKKRGEAVSEYYGKQAESTSDTEYGKSAREKYEQYKNAPTQYYADTIDDSTVEGKEAKQNIQQYADKEAAGKRLSASDRLDIEQSLYVAEHASKGQEQYQKYVREISQVPDSYRSAKSTMTVEEAQKALVDAAGSGNLQKLSDTYQAMKTSTSAEMREQADDMYSRIYGMAETNGIERTQLDALKVSPQDAYMEGMKGTNRAELGALSKEAQQAFNDGARKRIETGRYIVDSSSNLKGNVQTDNGSVTLNGSFDTDGKIQTSTGAVSVEDIMDGTAVKQAYVNASAQKTISAKNAYIANIKDGTNLHQYDYGFNSFYRAGATGITYENAVNGGFASVIESVLGKDTTEAIYNAGLVEYKAEMAREASAELGKAFGVKKGTGTFTDARTGKKTEVNTDFMDLVAKATGLNVVLTNKNNRGEQASFNASTSTIAVTEDHASQLIHELGEFVEAYAGDEYEKIRESAMNTSAQVLGADTYQRTLDNYQRTYEKLNAGQSVLESSREMTNDYLVSLMSTEEGQNALADYMVKNYGAKEAKSLGGKIKDFFDKIVTSLKNMLNNTSLNGYQKKVLNAKITDTKKQAEQFLAALDKAVENYRSAEETKGEEVVKNSLSVEEMENLSKEDMDNYLALKGVLESVRDGSFDTRNHIQVMEHTPKILQEAGLEDKPIFMTVQHFNNITHSEEDGHSEYHGLTDEEVAQAPVLLNNPTIIADSLTEKASVIVISHSLDYKNRPILLALKTDGKARSIELVDSNFMTSMYGRNNAQSFMQRLFENDNILFMDKTKSQALYNGFGVQFPAGIASLDFDKIIHQSRNAVNKNSLSVDSEGNTLSEDQVTFFENSKVRNDDGKLKICYHGTGRADRVGYLFDPERATSGPMAYFTDNKVIADNYAKDKKDTSISRDERYDNYFTQVRINIEGKDMAIGDAWKLLPSGKRNEIMRKAPHVTFDEDYETIIYDAKATRGLGNFDSYKIKEHDGNYLNALVSAWLEDGDLYDREADFLDVLKLVGIDNAEYLDPNYRDEKTYEVYLNITNPFVATEATEDFADELAGWWKQQDQSKYDLKMYSADMWDKSNMPVEQWIDKVRDDIENHTTHAWTVIPDAVTDYLKENGYDGIQDEGGKKGGESHTVYIPFESNQIKDINNEHPSENPDIRYSLGIDDNDFFDIFGGNNEVYGSSSSILEDGMEALKNQEVNTEAVRKIAVKLRNEYGSTINVNTFSDMLNKAFAYMQTSGHASYEDMMRILQEIATPVIDQCTHNEGEEIYQNFVNALKTYKIKLNEEQMQEVTNAVGSYTDFKKAMSPLNFSKNGTSLNSVWNEMVEASGYALEENIAPANQPLALYDTLSALRPTPVNDFGGNADDVASDLAMRIVEEYFGTQSDEKMKKLSAQMRQKNKEYRAKIRERYNDRLAEARQGMKDKVSEIGQKKADEIAELKARNKKTAQNAREKRAVKEEKQKIAKRAKTLMKWVSEPTDEHHIPKDMEEPVLSFLNALDFVEPDIKQGKDGNYSVRIFVGSQISNGRRKMLFDTITGSTRSEVLSEYYQRLNSGKGSLDVKSWALRMSQMKGLLEAARDGRDYNNSNLDGVLEMFDPEMADQLSDLMERNNGVASINNLPSSDLHTINNLLRGIIHAVNMKNKAITQNATIEEWAKDTIQTASQYKSKDHSVARQKIQKNLTLDMMTPETYFTLIGKSGEKIYSSINQGFNRKVMDIKQASDYMKETLKDVSPKELAKWTGKKAEIRTFQVFDGTIDLTPAHIMSLYELNQRQQATLHYRGGIEVDTMTVKNKGLDMEHAQNQAVHLTDEDLTNIFSTMTDEQKRVADKIQSYMANQCAAQGNEASMLMYGYEKFRDPNYFPISVDKSTTAVQSDSHAKESLNGIERMGMTKPVNPNASNPIIVKDIFDVLSNHVTDMAAYHGYAPAIKDANRWINYKTKEKINDSYEKHITVQQAVNTSMGRTDNAGVDYYTKLIKDINGSERSGEIQTFWGGLVGNYKAAAIGANLRVVIQQPTAFFRAANVISPKYLAKSVSKSLPGVASKNIERIKEVSPTVWWKTQGYYETSIGKSIKEIITGQSSVRDKITEKSMWLAGKADDITWSALYTAVEKEQADLTKGKGLSEDEFREKVNERFDSLIAQTQVVDATIQKSQWMRGNTAMNKLQTAFMTEPTKSYNMAMKAMIQDSRSYGNNILKWKATRKAAIVLAVTNVVNALAQSLIDGIRKKEDDEDYLESVLNNFQSNVIDNMNPFGLVPGLKDVFSSFVDAFKGESSYGSSFGQTMDAAAISSITDSIGTTSKIIQGNSNKTGYGIFMTYAKTLSYITGIPVYNFTRDASSIYNLFTENKLKKTKEKDSDKYQSVYSQIEKEKDVEDIQTYIDKAMEQGGTIKDIKSGIKSHLKEDYVDSLETNPDYAGKLKQQAVNGLTAIGLTKSEIEDEIKSWEDPTYGYSSLDKAIQSGEGIEDEIRYLQENKDNDKIAEHIMSEFSTTIEYNRNRNIGSKTEESVNKALRLLDSSYSYDAVKEVMEQEEIEKAQKAEKQEAIASAKQATYDIIDGGNGDYKTAIDKWNEAGAEASSMKSSLTTDYAKPLVKAYMEGDKSTETQLRRIALVKAYIDQKNGTNIAKKYGGDYYQYEIDQIGELMNKYNEEPW